LENSKNLLTKVANGVAFGDVSNQAVRNILTCINLAGLEMDYMFLEPIASASAVLCDDEKEAGVAIVDIGGGTTDIEVFYDSIICHTAVIPFGGNIITDDIRQGCSILKKQADEIKVRFGSAVAMENSEDEVVSIPGIHGRPAKEISFKNLSYIIQARLEEIFDLVKFEIEKVNSVHKLATGIVLTGGGSMMKHIAQLAEFKTGMEVRLGNPSESLAKDEELSCPMYSTGIGLVLEGFAKYENDINRVASQNKEIKKETVSQAQEEQAQKEIPEKPVKKRGTFNIIDIITNFSNKTGFFKQDEIE
jgi:cell division protein FtsA